MHTTLSGRPPPHRPPLSAPAAGLASAENVSVTLLTLSLVSFVSAMTPPVTGKQVMQLDLISVHLQIAIW